MQGLVGRGRPCVVKAVGGCCSGVWHGFSIRSSFVGVQPCAGRAQYRSRRLRFVKREVNLFYAALKVVVGHALLALSLTTVLSDSFCSTPDVTTLSTIGPRVGCARVASRHRMISRLLGSTCRMFGGPSHVSRTNFATGVPDGVRVVGSCHVFLGPPISACSSGTLSFVSVVF